MELTNTRKEMDEKYTWSEAYNTGVKFIDEQHQYFFNIVSTLLIDAGCMASNISAATGA